MNFSASQKIALLMHTFLVVVFVLFFVFLQVKTCLRSWIFTQRSTVVSHYHFQKV